MGCSCKKLCRKRNCPACLDAAAGSVGKPLWRLTEFTCSLSFSCRNLRQFPLSSLVIENNLLASPLLLPVIYLKAVIKSPLSLLFFRLNHHNPFNLSAEVPFSILLIIFLALLWILSNLLQFSEDRESERDPFRALLCVASDSDASSRFSPHFQVRFSRRFPHSSSAFLICAHHLHLFILEHGLWAEREIQRSGGFVFPSALISVPVWGPFVLASLRFFIRRLFLIGCTVYDKLWLGWCVYWWGGSEEAAHFGYQAHVDLMVPVYSRLCDCHPHLSVNDSEGKAPGLLP